MFEIRLAKYSDSKNIFLLSNDPIVRKNSFSEEPILWENHISWFTDKIKNKNNYYFVIESEQKEFVGLVRFDSCKDEEKSFVVGIGLSEFFRGKGLGRKILKDISYKMISTFKAEKIYAFIKEDNQASLKVFSDVGYKIISKEIINNCKAFKLLLKNI